jgi:hypothetical protein
VHTVQAELLVIFITHKKKKKMESLRQSIFVLSVDIGQIVLQKINKGALSGKMDLVSK